MNASWLWDVYDNAWKEGMKSVYYIRSLKKGEKIVNTGGNDCVGCAG